MLQFKTVPEALQHWAKHKADHPAFIFRSPRGDRHVQTFEQIYLHGGRYAAVLRAGGAARGHLVANTLPNCPERVVCEAAILMTGAASVNAMCQLADGSDLLRTLRVSRAMVVLVDPDVMRSPWHVLKNYVTVGDDNNAVSEELPHLRKIYFVRRTPKSQDDFLSKLDVSSDWYNTEDLRPDDVCTVFLSSGTSGLSKLVVHTHEGISQASLRQAGYQDMSGDLVIFSSAPLGAVSGYCYSALLGYTRVSCDTRDCWPSDYMDFMLKSVQEEKVHYCGVLAAHLNMLLEKVKQQKKSKDGDSESQDRNLQIVDRIGLGGHPITRHHVQTASLMARSVLIGYGSTECLFISTLIVTDPDTYKDFDCGMPVNDGEVKIVGIDEEETSLPAGKVGGILFKRPLIMKEYLYDPDQTTAAFNHDGFFRTGDIGLVDDRGHLIVEGRGCDAIMHGPRIIYPGWLEERIRICPGVSDVIIVGVPDPGYSEELCACVILKSEDITLQQVQAFVEKDVVTSDNDLVSARPGYYLPFDCFPFSAAFKPDRKVIKQQAIAKLSLASLSSKQQPREVL